MKKLFLIAPETQISDYAKATIEEWDEEPTALQLLKTLDYCIFTAEASGFVIKTIEVLMDKAIEREATTYEDIVKLAVWRKM